MLAPSEYNVKGSSLRSKLDWALDTHGGAAAEELERRLERVTSELSSASNALSELESQGDLFSGRLGELADARGLARRASDAARAP